MQIVSIDLFKVPEESKKQFLEESHKVQDIIKSVPGFVEGYTYKIESGDSDYNFVTSVTWQNEEAFAAAGKAVWEAFQKQNFNPQEVFTKLNVVRIRSEYTKTPY